MGRLTLSGLRRDRKARWLTILAGTAGATFFFMYALEMAFAEGLSGRVSLVYTHSDSTSTDSTGQTTDLTTRAFAQQYGLSADKNLYPNLKLFASGLFQKSDTTSSTNGQGSWSTVTVIRPYIDLSLRTPVFSMDVNYNSVTTESKALNAKTTIFKHDAYGGILGWRPEGLPTLDVFLTRSYNYDVDRALQDTVTDSASLTSRYDPTKTVRLRYDVSYGDTQNRITEVEQKRTGNDMRIMYDDQYLRDRVSVSAYYDYSYSTSEITTSGRGTVSLQVFAVDGLFLNSDNLLTDPLRSSPFLIDNITTGPTNAANNIGSATFAAAPPDTVARNIGLQFATAVEMNTLDVWVYSLTTLDPAVPAFLSATVADSFTWAVYTSSDNLNWQLYQTGVPATYEIDAAHPGAGRFEITFPNVVTRYIKVVVSPLSPFAAGGHGRDFPGIYVTELQAFTAKAAADVKGKTSATGQLAGLSTRVKLLKTPDLYYNFSYFYNRQESQFSATVSTTMTNALSVQHQFNPVFSGSATVQRVDDSSPAGNQVLLQASAQIIAVPLPTLTHALGLSSATIQRPAGRSKNSSLTLTNTALLYTNITAFLNGGLSTSLSETDQKTDSTNYSAGINLLPIETLNITMSSTGQKSVQSGGNLPDSTSTTRTYGVDTSYYPFRALYLFASWSVSVTSGTSQGTDRRANYGLNWSPFPGGDLVFNFSYFESQRNVSNEIDKTWTPSLRWNITRRANALVSYTDTRSTSDVQRSTTKVSSASFNVNF